MPAEEGSLYRMLQWARAHGDITTVKRIRVMVLPLTVRERIILDKVTAETEVSSEYLDAVRSAITAVVGQECPR